MYQSAGAHGARFNCSKQFTAFQTMVAEGGTGLAQGDDLGVGRGIGIGEVAVLPAGYDFSLVNDNSADRNFSRFECALGGAQRFLHEEFVGAGMSFLWAQRITPRDGV
jgi:hypothetical protein